MSEIKSSFARRVSRSSTSKSQPTSSEQSPIKSSIDSDKSNESLNKTRSEPSFGHKRPSRDKLSQALSASTDSLPSSSCNSTRDATPSRFMEYNGDDYDFNPNEQFMTDSYWAHDSSLIPNLKPQFTSSSQILKNIRPLDKGFITGNSYDNPLPYLIEEEKRHNVRLDELLEIHKSHLEKGVSVKSVRSMIYDVLKSLFYVNQAFVEIYSKESIRKSGILTSFQNWEESKLHIKEVIEEISSEENEEGKRLKNLREESQSVNDEIEGLEKRLNQLRDKKRAIDKEIDQCQSVIDSRTSSQYEKLSQIENYERLAMIQLNAQDSTKAHPQPSSPVQNPNSTLSFSLILSKLSIIKQTSTDPGQYHIPQMMETLSRQIESINDKITKYSHLEVSFNETLIIWDDITTMLNSLEDELQLILKSRLTSVTNEDGNDQIRFKIMELLKKYRDLLAKREEELSMKDKDHLKGLLDVELQTLVKGIEMLQ